jgi:putative transposase
MRKKKVYSSEEKAIILREHLENNVPISELAEKHLINPNVIYNWKKQLFEQAPQSLSRKPMKTEKKQSALERRVAELEALLAKRESLISELVADNIELKKNTAGVALTKNGLNRR